MIKQFTGWILAGTMLMTACGKKETTTCNSVDPASEESTIVAYNTARGFTAVKHPSGLYYQILNAGTGVVASSSSQVTVQYTGKLFNGTTFDSSAAGVQFPLASLIQGWQIGIPLIRVGGTIRLILPSAYGYGCRGSQSDNPSRPSIPPNAPLFFEIKLLAVN